MAFEVILDRIPDAKQKPTRAKPVLELSAFQPVSRDFAFIVDRGVKAGDIVRAAQGVDKKLITGVTVFDVYEGKGIDDGKKSIAIAVTIQPREKTLTDQEIDAVGGQDRRRGDQEDRRQLAGMMRKPQAVFGHVMLRRYGMSLAGLIPADVSLNAAIAICAIAFVSGTARGFSGFGSALIFMPLASSMAAPRLVAALLLVIDFIARRAAASQCLAAGRPQGDRRDGGRRAGRRADRNLFPQPARSGDDALDHLRLRRRAVAAVAVGLALSRQGSSGAFRRHRRPCPAFAAGWRRPAGRRSSAIGSAGRSRPVIARANILLFFGASDFFSLVSYAARRPDHTGCRSGSRCWSARSTRSASGSARQLFGRASETLFRAICYALIAAAVIIGLPALDGVLR